MNLINFLKSEFSVLKKIEKITLLIAFVVILINAILLKDSPYAIINAICGILYTFLAGKGVVSCYYFGLMGSSCYGYLSFLNGFWGNLILYVAYYIPMQVLGVIFWKKNLKVNSNQIKKKLE